MFRSGKIKGNDKIVKPYYIIKDSDQISSFVRRHKNPVLASKINVIKETDDLLVINKLSSIPVHTILSILSKEYLYTNLF